MRCVSKPRIATKGFLALNLRFVQLFAKVNFLEENDMPKILSFVAITCSVVTLFANPVAAQGVFDLGKIAKSVAEAPGAVSSKAGPATPPPSAGSLAQLTFKPSASVRKKVIDEYVKGVKALKPEVGAQMEAGFAKMDVLGEIAKGLAGYGLKADNMADAYAYYFMTAWMGAQGRTDDFTRAQISGVQNMVRTTIASNKELLALEDSKKQFFAESLLLQGLMNDEMTKAVANDAALKTKVMGDLKLAAKELSLDLDAFVLTPAGLVRK